MQEWDIVIHDKYQMIAYVYNQLHNYSLNELERFIKVSGSGLAQDVEEGDYNGLVEVQST